MANMLTHADLEVGSVLGQLDLLTTEIPPLAPVLLSEGGWRAFCTLAWMSTSRAWRRGRPSVEPPGKWSRISTSTPSWAKERATP